MIRPVKRSVTSFFVPMIDVLTVLFCMFLLMPSFRENESPPPVDDGLGKMSELDKERQRQLEELRSQKKQAEALMAALQAKRRDFLLKNLRVIVLDINPRDGSLSYYDPKKPGQPPVKIASEDKARQLIADHRVESGPLELFYMFQRPHDPGVKFPLYPIEEQREKYGQWFRGVACGGFVTQLAEVKGKQP